MPSFVGCPAFRVLARFPFGSLDPNDKNSRQINNV